MHNELASTAGVQQPTLILDGQQRLTALNVGLRGFYEIRKPRGHWNNPGAWSNRRLHLDLFHDLRQEDSGDSEEGEMTYRFAFRSDASDNRRSHWFKVGRILDAPKADDLEDLVEAEQGKLPEGVTKHEERAFNRNLRRLHEAVWRDDTIWYHTEQEADADRVLDIFVRANSGGTTLTKSDLLLSMVTARWRGVNARDEIYGFVDRLNHELTRSNNFNKDFVMKTCLAVCDLPVRYRVQNFSDKNLGLIFEKWEEIKSSIEAGVRLANHFGMDRDTLLSQTALIPVIYYLHALGKGTTLRGSTRFEASNASVIRRWLTAAMIGNAFGGQSDTVLNASRQVIREAMENDEKDFPVKALNRRMAELNRSTEFDEAMVDDILTLSYGGGRTFLALTLMYDRKDWGTTEFHQDHIFPRALFTDEKLEAAGIPAEKWGHYRQLRDRLGNLELLLSHENEEKSAKDFADWIHTRDQDFRKEHLIPGTNELFALERFEDFVEAREALIRERLDKIFFVNRLQGVQQ